MGQVCCVALMLVIGGFDKFHVECNVSLNVNETYISSERLYTCGRSDFQEFSAQSVTCARNSRPRGLPARVLMCGTVVAGCSWTSISYIEKHLLRESERWGASVTVGCVGPCGGGGGGHRAASRRAVNAAAALEAKYASPGRPRSYKGSRHIVYIQIPQEAIQKTDLSSSLTPIQPCTHLGGSCNTTVESP
jgi:hypothetical protein